MKTILVTGANRGLGFEACKQLALDGHKIIMTGRDEAKLKQAAAKLSGNIIPLKMDVTADKEIENAAIWVKDHIGNIDVLINNAGSVFDTFPFGANCENPLSTGHNELRNTLELNLEGPYSVIKSFLPLLRKTQRTDIINVSSGMGSLHDMGTGAPAYRISKAALNALTIFLATELAATKIYVNSLCPGWCSTELGGQEAPRTPAEGIIGIRWIVNERPELRGKFIRDKAIISF